MAEHAEFRLSRNSWFCCPYCGYSAWKSYYRVRLLRAHPWMAFENKCPSCAEVCTQLRPGIVTAAIFLSLFASFPLAYCFAFRLGLALNSLGDAVLLGLVIGLAQTYLVMPLITRYVARFGRVGAK